MYRLSVVRTHEGSYLLNFYGKAEDTRLPDFASVISDVCDNSNNPEMFEREPALIGLSETETRAIQKVRSLVLEQRVSVLK